MNRNVTVGLSFIAILAIAVGLFFKFRPRIGTPVPVNLSQSCKTVKPDPVIVHLASTDTVQWTAADENYDILFANSPFRDIASGVSTFVAQGHANPTNSGPVIDSVKNMCYVDNPPAACQFHYDVSGIDNNCTNTSKAGGDPVVVVQK